jgi:hypothetical protein
MTSNLIIDASLQEQAPQHIKHTALRHTFGGTILCTRCTESSRHLYESRNSNHHSPHKIGHVYSSFPVLLS